MARFLHMADLHLGRALHQVRLLDDQRLALEGILGLLETLEPKVDAVLMAGDVYDRSMPPTEAVTLLTWFIGRVVNDFEIQVVMIPGNHDSAERMGFLANLTKDLVHIAPPLQSEIHPLVLADEHGSIDIFALPFLDPSLVRAVTGETEVNNPPTAMAAMVARMVASTALCCACETRTDWRGWTAVVALLSRSCCRGRRGGGARSRRRRQRGRRR